jgi:hypothetical protein
MTAGIAAFIAEKMSAYVAGGIKPDNFTRGELSAIYKGDHWSRDSAGKPQKTPPPEAVGSEAAIRKADAAIAGILKCCTDDARKKNVPAAQEKSGFEKMAEYAGR